MTTPATPDSITNLSDRLCETRSDLLVGQGQILKNAGDNTSAILRDANGNALMTNANIDRSVLAGLQETNRAADKLSSQANTIAWNETAMTEAGFAAQRAQNERINEAQSAFADRAAKFQNQMISDSFARLSAQGENGFARGLDAANTAAKQVVQSEMGVTRSLGDGFRDGSASLAANYASLSQQNCGTKEMIAAYGNRTADQTAAVLATLTAQHSGQTRDLQTIGRDLSFQGATNTGAIQLEAAKNALGLQLEASRNMSGLQLQASVNAKESAIQAAVNAKDIALQAAVNSKESVLQAAFLAKENLLENSKWFALAEKTAMVNKCDLEAKMAACCCEIKESVIGTANATQSLIQTNESARVRDALSAAVAENSILRLGPRVAPAPYPYPYPMPYPHHHHHPHRGDSPPRGR